MSLSPSPENPQSSTPSNHVDARLPKDGVYKPRKRPTQPRRYGLVIFDMDGTLTEERLDFPRIREEMGVPDGVGILEFLTKQSGETLERANAILQRHEDAAAETCTLYAGAHEVLAALRAEGIKTALLTRNSLRSTTRILGKFSLKLDHIATRENQPHKPHGDSILNVVRHFGVVREQTLMVGDYLYDLQAARRAWVRSVLIRHRDEPMPVFAPLATYTAKSLHEVLELATGRTVGDFSHLPAEPKAIQEMSS